MVKPAINASSQTVAERRRIINLRRSVRPAPIVLTAILLDTPDQINIRITSTDLCETGMAFDCDRYLHQRARLAIKFPCTNETVKIVVARVRYCRQTSGDLFHVGVEFLEASLV